MFGEVAISGTCAGGDQTIHIWDLRTGALLSSLKGNQSDSLATDIVPALSHGHGAAALSNTIVAIHGTASNSTTNPAATPIGTAAAAATATGTGTGTGTQLHAASSQIFGGAASSASWISPSVNGWLQSSLILSAQSDRATINAWSFSRAQPLSKSVVPEKLMCLTISYSGIYCAAGGASGRLYLWEIATGNLLRMFDAHYKPIKVLRFTADDSCILSGGEDAMIHVWQLVDILDESIDHQQLPLKLLTLKGHTLPITDIACGLTLASHTRCFSVSLDKTCRIWDLASGSCLLTILSTRSLSCVQVTAMENIIFVGCADGTVRAVDLYGSADGQSAKEITQGTMRDADADPQVFRGHTGPITCMSLSMDETLLVTGSEDGDCIVWDSATRQALRTFKAHKTPVSFVKVVLKPHAVANPETHTRSTIETLKRFPVPRSIDESSSGESSSHVHAAFTSHGLEQLTSDDLGRDLDGLKSTYHESIYNEMISSQTTSGSQNGLSELDELRHRVALLEKQNAELIQLNDETFEKLSRRIISK
eukprot:jgi/Hompol1/6556/HPOL_000746-RA